MDPQFCTIGLWKCYCDCCVVTDAEWGAACFALWPTIRYNYQLQSGRCKNCLARTSWHNTSPAPAVIYTNVKRHQNQLNFMKQKMSLVKFRPFILLHWSPNALARVAGPSQSPYLIVLRIWAPAAKQPNTKPCLAAAAAARPIYLKYVGLKWKEK